MRPKITPPFNGAAKTMNDYTLTLARPDGNPSAQAEDFEGRLSRWLRMNGEDAKGNAELPKIADPTPAANARLTIRCTEEMLARIERQFAGDILFVTPPAEHQRGAIYPPKADPWDVSKW